MKSKMDSENKRSFLRALSILDSIKGGESGTGTGVGSRLNSTRYLPKGPVVSRM
jgi:hypothetical protein